MTTLASLLFTGIFALSAMVIVLAVSGAMPRIRHIVAAAHDGSLSGKTRRITIRVPVAHSAEIIPLPLKTAPAFAPVRYSDRLAA